MNVIMLDDSPTFLAATERILVRCGIQVTVLNSWMDVGPAIKRHRPDVLVLDFNMPGFDGMQVGSMIRRFSKCPILFLSSESTDTLTAACDAITNSCFVKKGNLKAELISKLCQLSSPAK